METWSFEFIPRKISANKNFWRHHLTQLDELYRMASFSILSIKRKGPTEILAQTPCMETPIFYSIFVIYASSLIKCAIRRGDFRFKSARKINLDLGRSTKVTLTGDFSKFRIDWILLAMKYCSADSTEFWLTIFSWIESYFSRNWEIFEFMHICACICLKI